MKICIVTERSSEFSIGSEGQFDTNDINIAAILGADRHFSLISDDMDRFTYYDLVILKMSKTRMPYEKTWMEFAPAFKKRWPNKILFIYQEAEVNWLLERSIDEQCELIQALKICDLFLAHNINDIGFFSNLWDRKVIHVPTPLPINRIKEKKKTHEERLKAFKFVFGSSFDNRANGLFGLAAAKQLKRINPHVNLVQYTRSKYEDDRNAKISNAMEISFSTIPQLGWFDFIEELSTAYVSMNLMPAAAAGRDAIVFAALGIPHVGNSRLDSMQYCFPDLCVDVLSVDSALFRVIHMLNNESEVKRISEYAMKKVEEHHSFESVKAYLKMAIKNSTGIVI